MNQILFFIILAILVFASYGALRLSLVDFKEKNICPKAFSIPACYIVFFFFLLANISHILSEQINNYLLYFVFIGVPFLLALGGTLTELSGKDICPKTPGGTPMCFISLAITTALIILKIIEISIV